MFDDVAVEAVLASARHLRDAWNEYVDLTAKRRAPAYQVEAAWVRFYLALDDACRDVDDLDDTRDAWALAAAQVGDGQ